MLAALTGTQPNLDAEIDPRFGQCTYFLLVDTDTMDVEAVENTDLGPGQRPGIKAAKLLAQRKVNVLLTGNCGANAQAALSTAGITVIRGCSGTVREAVEQFKAGKLKPEGSSSAVASGCGGRMAG